MEYGFKLRFVVPIADWDVDDLVSRLGAVGCTDALVGIGVAGRLGLDFSRESSSAEAAIFSAIEDVKAAIPSASLVSVGPDLVGLTDIADLLQVTRQNVRKLAFKHASFPAPFHTGTTDLWRLLPVIDWFSATGAYAIDARLREVCAVAMQVNNWTTSISVPKRIERELARLVGLSRISATARRPSRVLRAT
jgi:hypothetical protein